jgi:hypothetical protein
MPRITFETRPGDAATATNAGPVATPHGTDFGGAFPYEPVGVDVGALDLNVGMSPRGERLLGRVPRLPQSVATEVVDHFGELSKILRATTAELMDIGAVNAELAHAIKDSLARLTEEAILEQYA